MSSSEPERRLTIICYDISHPRRRRRVARLLLGYGDRIQLSAYACWLTKRERRELLRLAILHIDPESDSLRFYELRPEDSARARTLGNAPPAQNGKWICA